MMSLESFTKLPTNILNASCIYKSGITLTFCIYKSGILSLLRQRRWRSHFFHFQLEVVSKPSSVLQTSNWRWTTGGSLVCSVSPSHCSRSLPASWPSCTQRIKEAETSVRTHASHAQPRIGFLYIYTRRSLCTHKEDKAFADVRKVDKIYISFKPADYKWIHSLADFR